MTRFGVVAAGLVLLGAGTWAGIRLLSQVEAPPSRIVPLTSLPGQHYRPDFSPDGTLMAFSWNGENQDNKDIYIKEVDGTGFRRLTTDPAPDTCPKWSPDGRQIAFVRLIGSQWNLHLVSSLGGDEKKVTGYDGGVDFSWSRDGKRIAFAATESPAGPLAIWSLTLGTLEREQLTRPTAGRIDVNPVYSPDGRSLAFARLELPKKLCLYVMPLPHGEPRLVTNFGPAQSFCWTADSRELIFNTTWTTGESALYRIPVEGGRPGRIPTRGNEVLFPAVSPDGNRLAYVSDTFDQDIWRMELAGERAMKTPTEPLISSTMIDSSPAISPDGKRIAFLSIRSGTHEIWACDADGANPVRLTNITEANSPSWSPDGTRIGRVGRQRTPRVYQLSGSPAETTGIIFFSSDLTQQCGAPVAS